MKANFSKASSYPLAERIGNPDLFIGREKEFAYFHRWIQDIPNRLSKSKAILARKKSGKTAIVQRLFNQLWSENGDVIPFYYEIADRKTWLPDFAIDYYRRFASQYIAFRERDPKLIQFPLSLEEIREYGKKNQIRGFTQNVDELQKWKSEGNYDLMWNIACWAPHHFAALYDQRILVILDEFQNMNRYIYRDQDCVQARDETMAGSYHELSESKIAPMLVTGSYVGWLVNVINQYLEAGRLKFYRLSPYLSEEEGLEAIYQYAQLYKIPIQNETAILLNQLCFSDPFFISCILLSDYENKDLTTEDGIKETIRYEISNREAELARTWADYINLSLHRINNRNAKQILLHLSKHPGQEWTHRELKKELELDIELNEILEDLIKLVSADLILEGASDIAFKGLDDGALSLILYNRFEEEIHDHRVDLKEELTQQIQTLKQENRSLRNKLNSYVGKSAEDLLATDFRTRKRFSPSIYFSGMEGCEKSNWTDVRTRIIQQRNDGKSMEIDIKAESSDGGCLLVEVKKWKTPVGVDVVEDFWEKVQVYTTDHPEQKVLPAFFSLGGFRKKASEFCLQHKIGMATEICYVKTDWS